MLHTILVIWCCQKKNNKVNIILRMKVICQALALTNLHSKNWKFSSIDELRVEEGKENKDAPMKVQFIWIVTTVYLLFAVLYQAFKPRLLVALVSFKSPLATGRLPFFSPECFFFSLILFFCSRHICQQWSVMQHFLTVKLRYVEDIS